MYFWIYAKLMFKAIKDSVDFLGSAKAIILAIVFVAGYLLAEDLSEPFQQYKKYTPVLICFLVVVTVIIASYKVWKEEYLKTKKDAPQNLKINFEKALLGMHSYSGIAIKSLTIKYQFSIYNNTEYDQSILSIDLDAIRAPLNFEKIPVREQSSRIFPLHVGKKTSNRIEILMAYDVEALDFEHQSDFLLKMNELRFPAKVTFDTPEEQKELTLDIIVDSKAFLYNVYHDKRNVFNENVKEKIKVTLLLMGVKV